MRVTVKFSNANTAASPTLNVDSTGAKAIYWHGAALVSSQYWQAGAVLDFVYNGTQWELIGIAKDNNTTYSVMGAATSSAAGTSGLVPAPAAGKQASFLRGDGTWVVPTNTTYSAATDTVAGLMSITTQTFAGDKTFKGSVIVDENKSTSGYVKIYESTEGGNIVIHGPSSGYSWEMDAYQTSSFRLIATKEADATHKFFTFDGSNGSMSMPGVLTADALKVRILNIPTSSGGSTYGAGSSGQVLKSNGTTVYWDADNNTTYSAGTGISISSNQISNSGVRSISTGSTNGTISVNTNGTSTDVAVKGLGSNAYTSTAYLPLAGGTITGALTVDNGESSGKVELSEDNEGGTIRLFSKSGTYCYEMDAYDDENIRIHTAHKNPNGEAKFISWNGKTGALTTVSVYGAVWNDYAEYRKTTEEIEAGRVVIENGDDTLSLATERLMPGANVVSDTFGFAIGKTDTAKTPLAVSGRALAYPYEDRNSYKPGDPVCSGPNGTISKMTREEVMAYPDRIIGTVSAIPEYDTWGTGNIAVNERIWIKVK